MLLSCLIAWASLAHANFTLAQAPNARLSNSEREDLRGDLDQYSNELYGRENLEKRRQFLRDRAIQRFRDADRSGNGSLDREELRRHYPNAARHFDRIDTDKDGEVTQAEMAKALRTRLELRRRHLDGGFDK
ncbi:MAG: hypothetical protein HXY27_06365 [Hydrogenophilaceae bacterium]|nr:hypothetical protein [Hydrogenophilaceae bacterium]